VLNFIVCVDRFVMDNSCDIRTDKHYFSIPFNMKVKPTNTYKHLRVSYIINIVNLLRAHVSTILVAILREVSCKGHITKIARTSAEM